MVIQIKSKYKLLLKKNYSYLIKCIYPIFLAIVTYLYLRGREVDSVEHFLLYVLGGSNIYEMGSLFDILIFAMPFILYLYLFGSLIFTNIDKASVFILTRANKRSVWFLKKIAFLFFCTLIYYLVLLITFTILLRLDGINFFEMSTYMYLFYILLLNCTLNSFVFVLLINILSIKYKNLAVLYSITIISYYLIQFILIPRYEVATILISLWPSMQCLLFLHDISFLKHLDESYFIMSIDGFTVEISLIYNLVLISLMIFIGKNIIRESDFL